MARTRRRPTGSPRCEDDRHQGSLRRHRRAEGPAGVLSEPGNAAVVVASARLSGHRRDRQRDVPLLRHPLRAARRPATGWSPLIPRPSRACRPMSERILIVAPSWVGDAILSEPLIARLRAMYADPVIDVLAPPWCGPVYARMRGVRNVIANPIGHGRLDLRGRAALARSFRDRAPRGSLYPRVRAAEFVEVGAGALAGRDPDPHRLSRRIALGPAHRCAPARAARPAAPRRPVQCARRSPRCPAAVPRRRRRRCSSPMPIIAPPRCKRSDLAAMHPFAVLCPGAEYGPAKRWPAEHFAALATRFIADGMRVWLVGSPNDRAAADAVVAAAGEPAALSTSPAQRTSARPSTSCRSRRSSSATTPA